ncbi:uncharacterized protein PV09_02929 [Verruconis gallopava]|uniref:Rad51-like C-terminal domain-containing protein n=1 Tax=Verruconis gallopava TaxID=253628 RepID=A0A0D2AHY6_9PEZI|nr:uncharacterized protein PV09_02929 [Verruconis gallopava]KIW06493.1 hypothetical protein PV09_02929 [Verruconis gallopava]
MPQAILASALYKAAKLHESALHNAKIASGYTAIDEALNGGFKCGQITCISGERGNGKTLIAFHVIANHLLSSQGSQAAIIDTTGTFDVLRLRNVIVDQIKDKRVHEHAAAAREIKGVVVDHDDALDETETIARQALDRMKIMRVFDFVGLREAINEIKEDLENVEKDEEVAGQGVANHGQQTCIADSQAEDGDEDIMASDAKKYIPESPKLESVSLLVVDNITSVLNPHLKTDYVQGQALLTTFMRYLSSLTVTFRLTTLLLNNAASPNKTHLPFPNLALLNSNLHLPSSTYISEPLSANSHSMLDQPSIFSSTTARPSLGKTFTGLVDCHVLLSMIPKRRRDAEIFVGGKSGDGDRVGVLEVLCERGGNGVGRWAAFEIGLAGTELKFPI